MKKNILSVAVSAALLSASILPFAANADIHFSGFASIVGGTTLADDEGLYGYNDNIDFKQGSLVALQASSDLGDGLGVTVQLTAKGLDNWDPKFKWAYVSYDPSDDLRILAGRQVAPFYMYSDYLNVSYAYPWISPPNGVYDILFDTFDGLGAIYNTPVGDGDLVLHGIYGRITDEIDIEGSSAQMEVNDLLGFSATYNYDWLTFRSSYFVADITLANDSLDSLSAGWAGFGFSSNAQQTAISEDSTSFFEVGFQAQFDKIIVVGEYTNLQIDNTPFGEEKSYFIMAGYQFDSMLVHLTFGVDEDSINDYAASATAPAGISGTDLATFNEIKAGTQGFLSQQNNDESYFTLGARYEFHDSAALKFEYTSYTDDNNSNNDAGLLRAALVTVF